MKTQIDTLVNVSIREVWPSEPAHFTPWLSSEKNIEKIGSLIGRDLLVLSSEHSVGSYKADILCEDQTSNEKVIIENQYGKTDHIHLGQIITYAAGVGASTMIWISEKFTEEHRAAIDWLNENTNENVEFYGIEIELFRIGNSLPAPRFNIVSKPNSWSRTLRRTSEGGQLTDTKLLQLEYWQMLEDFAQKEGFKWKMGNPKPRYWTTVSLGRSDFRINVFANTRNKRIGVKLVVKNPNANAKFELLKANYEGDSRNAIDPNLEWDLSEDRKRQFVKLRKPNTDPFNKADWTMQHKYLAESIDKFIKFFTPKIENI